MKSGEFAPFDGAAETTPEQVVIVQGKPQNLSESDPIKRVSRSEQIATLAFAQRREKWCWRESVGHEAA